MQKGFAPILILVGILVIAAIGGAFYLGKQTSKPSQPQNQVVTSQATPSSTQDTSREPNGSAASPVPNGTGETVNWKTYTNTKAGYSIKYPPEWYVLSPRKNDPLDSKNIRIAYDQDLKISQQLKKDETYASLDILIKDSDGKTAKEFLLEHEDIKEMSDKIFTQKIDKYEAYTFQSQRNQYTALVKNGILYEFQLIAAGSNQRVNMYLGSESISTFKFLDQTSGAKECKPTGCSGEICSDKDEVSICIIRTEDGCYENAKCERQSNGECGWTQTEELKSCLQKP